MTKTKLLEATTAAIDTYEARKAEFDKLAAQYVDRHHSKAVGEALEAQKALRDTLSAALKAKKPLNELELKMHRPKRAGSSYGYLSDYAGPSEKADPPRSFRLDGKLYEHPRGVPLEDLKALKATLEAVTEEEISDGQLQRLGFKNLGWVFRAAVANT